MHDRCCLRASSLWDLASLSWEGPRKTPESGRSQPTQRTPRCAPTARGMTPAYPLPWYLHASIDRAGCRGRAWMTYMATTAHWFGLGPVAGPRRNGSPRQVHRPHGPQGQPHCPCPPASPYQYSCIMLRGQRTGWTRVGSQGPPRPSRLMQPMVVLERPNCRPQDRVRPKTLWAVRTSSTCTRAIIHACKSYCGQMTRVAALRGAGAGGGLAWLAWLGQAGF